MKITIENTSKIVQLVAKEIPARIWEGKTESGIPIHCFVTRIGVANEEDQIVFQKELQETRKPSPAIEAIDARLIL